MLCKTLWLYNAGISKEIIRTVVISTAQWNLSHRTALFDGIQNSFPPPPPFDYVSLALYWEGEDLYQREHFPQSRGFQCSSNAYRKVLEYGTGYLANKKKLNLKMVRRAKTYSINNLASGTLY